jgi:hypothetical protein
MNLLYSLGGRKFFLAILSQLMSSFLVYFSKVTPDVYLWLVLGTVGAFITGNAIDTIVEKGFALRGKATNQELPAK